MPDKFRDSLRHICARPAIYVGRYSIVLVYHYIAGYCHGLVDAGDKGDPLNGFMSWAQMRFGIRHSAWHWTRILLHVYGNDLEALNVLPALYEEFVRDRDRLGIAGIEAETTDGSKQDMEKISGNQRRQTPSQA